MPKNIKVHNVVASGGFDKKVPLTRLSVGLKRTEYEPEQFPGLVYRLDNPKAAALIFNSGKIVCTGTKSVAQAHEAVANLLKDIQEIDPEVTAVNDLTIQNMVASTFFPTELNLNKIAFDLEGTEYEPEQFPGLVYRLDGPKVVFLLFKSGKVICTGAKSHEMIEESVIKLRANLKDIDIDLGDDGSVEAESVEDGSVDAKPMEEKIVE